MRQWEKNAYLMDACKVHPCGIYGCTKKQNRLLHSENQTNEGSHAVNVSAATINQVTSFHRIVPILVQSGGNSLNTYAFLDSGSTVSLIDQSVKDQLQEGRYLEHSWHTWDAIFEDREVSYHKKGTEFKGAFD